MNERLFHNKWVETSQAYERAWQYTTGEKARECVDIEVFKNNLLDAKDEIVKKVYNYELSFDQLKLANKVYMGIYEFNDFPEPPPSRIAKQN